MRRMGVARYLGALRLSSFAVFCQAEDGIRDESVTGVQTCALPIWGGPCPGSAGLGSGPETRRRLRPLLEIGRASCRGRGEISGVAVSLKKKTKNGVKPRPQERIAYSRRRRTRRGAHYQACFVRRVAQLRCAGRRSPCLCFFFFKQKTAYEMRV